MRTQSVILNLIPSGVNPVVHLSQYDQEDDGALLFNIYDGNVLADLTGCTATIEGTKPDGTFYMYPCTVYSTYLTCAVNFQMTSIAGSYPAEVRINRGGENVGTINITMMVEPAGVGRVDVSDTEIPSLLDDIETSVDEAEYWAHVAEHAVTGVASWNGRTGAVVPVAGDYDASQVDYDNSNSGLTATDTQGAIDELTPKKIITSNDAFDPTKTYAAGEWFIHQGVLYEVITACTGVTPPDITYYKEITLHDIKAQLDAMTMENVITNSNGSFYLRRVGKTVTCIFRAVSGLFPKTFSAWESYVLASSGSIPAQYLPQNAVYDAYFPILRQSQTNTIPIMFSVQYNSGNPRIVLQNQSNSAVSTGTYMEMPMTWIV